MEKLRYDSIGQWHDTWGWLHLSAIGGFSDVMTMEPYPDQKEALRKGFDRLREGYRFARRKIKDDRLYKIWEEILTLSMEYYLEGDTKSGSHALLEAEGMIWPSQEQKVKYAIEAEKRVFGELKTFAGITVSPYPREGTIEDLGKYQSQLMKLGERHVRSYQSDLREFKYFSWVIDKSGVIKRITSEPSEDTHELLKPAQRMGMKRIKQLAKDNEIIAAMIVSIVGPLGGGIVGYDIEELGRCKVSARQTFRRHGDEFQHNDYKYHLLDPQIFQ